MADVRTGRVLKFDEERGYGFIAPESGKEDVFFHANDLFNEKSLFRVGSGVRFQVEQGDRGLKAFDVRLAEANPTPPAGSAGPATPSQTVFGTALTEALLTRMPELTGAQIVAIRAIAAEVAHPAQL